MIQTATMKPPVAAGETSGRGRPAKGDAPFSLTAGPSKTDQVAQPAIAGRAQGSGRTLPPNAAAAATAETTQSAATGNPSAPAPFVAPEAVFPRPSGQQSDPEHSTALPAPELPELALHPPGLVAPGTEPPATAAEEAQLNQRFGDLLKLRTPQHPRAESAAGHSLQPRLPAEAAATQQLAGNAEDAHAAAAQGKPVPVLTADQQLAVKQVLDGLGHQGNQLHQPQPHVTPTGAPLTGAAPAQGPVTGGHGAADSQIFDQLVTHLSGSATGESGRMILRLHPAELGAIRIELLVEGDRVKAHLQAQTQQVHEALERNLGQLRQTLAEQGLKIDQLLVSSDSRQGQSHSQAGDLFHQRQQEPAGNPRVPGQPAPGIENQAIPLALLLNHGGGISLHV